MQVRFFHSKVSAARVPGLPDWQEVPEPLAPIFYLVERGADSGQSVHTYRRERVCTPDRLDEWGRRVPIEQRTTFYYADGEEAVRQAERYFNVLG